jgi:hypothetical protein
VASNTLLNSNFLYQKLINTIKNKKETIIV